MRIISFDAGARNICLCLMEGKTVLQEKVITPEGSNRQELAANLLPALSCALEQAGWNKNSLDAIVVGQGPGSFTGIRSAIVVARTMAYALKLPLIGLSRFEIIASYFQEQAAVLLPAYRNLCYMSALELTDNGTQTRYIVPPCCLEFTQLASALSKLKSQISCFVADPGIEPSLLPAEISFKPLPVIENPAIKQAEIAGNRLSLKTGNATESFPWSVVEPLYLREPSITLKTHEHNRTN